MKYFLDSANIELIEKWKSYIDGVTVNPFLLNKEKLTPEEFIKKTNEFDIMRFIPVFSWQDVEKLDCNPSIIYKVSILPEYYKLIEKIKSLNLLVSATTVYDIVQLNHAIELNCDFSMVYIAKNENASFLYEASKISRRKTKLVGASFRTKNHVKDAILAGMDYSTIGDEVLEKIFINEQAITEVERMKKI